MITYIMKQLFRFRSSVKNLQQSAQAKVLILQLGLYRTAYQYLKLQHQTGFRHTSSLLVFKQWGLYVKKTTATEKIVLPVTSTFLCGSVTDGGNGNNSYGLDHGLDVYGPSGGVSYICLCKAQANRQWVSPESNNAFSFPIAFTSNWTLIPCSEAPGIGYYAFLEVVRNGMTGATINTYSGSGQILDHTIRAIAIGW